MGLTTGLGAVEKREFWGSGKSLVVESVYRLHRTWTYWKKTQSIIYEV